MRSSQAPVSRVKKVEAKFARRVRKKLGLSQAEFSHRIDVSIDMVLSWEQGKCSPTGAVGTKKNALDN